MAAIIHGNYPQFELPAFFKDLQVTNWEFTDYGDGTITATVNYQGDKAMLSAAEKEESKAKERLQRYTKLKERVELLKQQHSDGKNKLTLGAFNSHEVLDIAKEALSDCILYEVMGHKQAEPPKNPTAKELAKELATDKEFMDELVKVSPVIQQAMADAAMYFTWLHAWWKDGTQYVGNYGQTLKAVEKKIAERYGVQPDYVNEFGHKFNPEPPF